MPDPIAEAFVAIRPDLTQFEGQLQRGVTQAVRRVQVPTTAQQTIAGQFFGSAFAQRARTSTTSAVSGITIPASTQRSFAQQLFGPGFRNESGRAIQGALVGLGGGELAARFAFFGAGGAGIAVLAGAFLNAAKSAGSFEQALNTLQAVTGVTDEELAQMSDLAKQLGADITLPAVTAQTAADAMTELAKAGLSVNDVMGAVRGTLQLATAAGIDAASAAQITASALNAFGLAGDQAVHVADLLAQASIESQASMQDLALALQQSEAVAKLSGLSIEQLIGALTQLANRGLLGSDAGTSLRVALLRLIPTTKEAAEFMEILGIRIDRTRTLGAQLPELLDQYHAALSRLNPTLRQQVLAQIAGQDAVRSLSFLIEGGGDTFNRYTRSIDENGAAQKLAEARTKGFFGALQGLQSQVQTLSINIGSLFIPALTDLVNAVTAVIEPVNQLFDALDKLKGIEINIPVHVEVPDIPGVDIPFLDKLRDFAPPVDLTRTLLGVFNPVIAQLNSLEQKGKAVSALMRELGFGEAATEAEKLSQRAHDLNEELFAGGTTRARAQEIQAELAQIDRKLKDLTQSAKQNAAGTADAFKLAFGDLGTFAQPPLQALEAQLKDVVDPNVLGKQLQLALAQLQRGDISDQAREAARGLVTSIIAELAQMGPEGERVLISAGGRLMRGLAEGITAEEQRAINAARRALQQVRQQGELEVQEAIRSARGNLESLGTDVSSVLADIIDVGPIGQAIDEIEKKLDELQERVTRRQLRFDLTQAKRDLKEAQDAIVQVGTLTPAQKRAQEDFLRPFSEKVKDAKASLQEFDLTKQQKELEDTRDAAVDAADKGIQTLILKFEDGKISAGEFERQLRNQLGPAFDIIGSKAAAALDPFTVINFRREVAALIKQAKELSAFFPLGAGTTPGAQVVRPTVTQQQVNQRIAESAASLARIESDAKRLSGEEQKKLQIIIGIQKQIARALGVGGGRTGGATSTVGRRPGDVTGRGD